MRVSLSEFLDSFTSQALGDACFQAKLSPGTTKIERTNRLIEQVTSGALSLPDVLENCFTVEDLKYSARVFEVRATKKADLVRALLQIVDVTLVAPPAEPPLRLPATRDAVIMALEALTFPLRKYAQSEEAELAAAIEDTLRLVFDIVTPQFNIGGAFGLKVDLDIGNGQVGIEVKLARKLVESASEAQRCIGQAIYYEKKRYAGNLIVAVVGSDQWFQETKLRDTLDFLESLGIRSVRVLLT